MVRPVSYNKFKAPLVSFYWECCVYYLLFLGIRRENSTSFYLSQSHNLTFGLFISVLNRYFWCPTFSGNTLVHSRGWWRLRSAFVFNRQERIHCGEELCWQGKNSDIKRQHRDPRIKLSFPAQWRVSAFETDIHKNNSVICSVLTLLSAAERSFCKWFVRYTTQLKHQ